MVAKEIIARIRKDLHLISAERRAWLKSHLIKPREIEAWSKEHQAQMPLWLLTEHTGEGDSQYRIVFDPDQDSFGLEMTSDDGTAWYMGPYSVEFAAVVDML
jgi:hypothetical protein